MEMEDQVVAVKKRLVSLDALRGFDMFWIIGGHRIFRSFADAADSGFMKTYILPQFRHVPWEGFTFEDLIMPLFLFIVGVAMPYSFGKRLALGDSKAKLYGHIIKRVLVLFFLGFIAQGRLLKFDLGEFQVYCNTLQSIAVGYLIASIIMLNLKPIGQIIATAGLLLLFWALMALVPVPGHGAGIYTPEVNFALYVDDIVLGELSDGLPYTWVLSSLTFGCTVMFGVWAGQILRSTKADKQKLLYLIYLGVGTIVLGLIWSIWFPIIKHIWTSSFTLYAAGLSYLCLALFYFIIDMAGYKKWAFPFVVVGMNAIFVYMIVQLFDFRILSDILVAGLEKWTGGWHGFIRVTLAFGILWSLLYYMYKKKTFVKI